jgi:serine/threonine-protein kinase
MLDYIIAKVLAKAPEARYQSAADFANDLRECRLQMETGQQGAGPALSTSRPIPVAPQGAAVPIAQNPGGESGEEDAPTPSPTKGISRAFDSQEATQRLMRQIGADGTTEFVSTKSISATSISRDRALRPGERPWGQRENVIFAATVVVALVIATAIVLA